MTEPLIKLPSVIIRELQAENANQKDQIAMQEDQIEYGLMFHCLRLKLSEESVIMDCSEYFPKLLTFLEELSDAAGVGQTENQKAPIGRVFCMK